MSTVGPLPEPTDEDRQPFSALLIQALLEAAERIEATELPNPTSSAAASTPALDRIYREINERASAGRTEGPTRLALEFRMLLSATLNLPAESRERTLRALIRGRDLESFWRALAALRRSQ